MRTFLTLLVAAIIPVQASEMVKPGADAPSFSLSDSSGKTVALSDHKGKYVVLEWTNRGCPYVVRHYQGNMQATQKKARDLGAVWFTVCSSAPGKQGFMSAEQAVGHYKAVQSNANADLFDPDGKVGHAYGARNTPQIVLISPEGKVLYNGAIDDDQRGTGNNVKNYALTALEEAKAGKSVSTPTSRPYGCSVKY